MAIYDEKWDLVAGSAVPAACVSGVDMGSKKIAARDISTKGANGQEVLLKQNTALSGAMSGTSLTFAALIPAGSLVIGVTAHPTTAITSGDGATTYDIGVSGDADRYGAAITFASDVTLANITVSGPAYYAAAADVTLAAKSGTFSGGVVRATVHYLTVVAATS
jgi:hypothetical protein